MNGLRVVESVHMPARRPKIQLRQQAPVSDRFRAEMDAWLLATFGDEAYMLVVNTGALGFGPSGGMIVTNPANLVMLRGLK